MIFFILFFVRVFVIFFSFFFGGLMIIVLYFFIGVFFCFFNFEGCINIVNFGVFIGYFNGEWVEFNVFNLEFFFC